jgi:hypothetical protein
MQRKLVWIEEQHFQGWGCSECAWVFNPSGAPTGNSLDEMKENYERQRDKDFAAHVCTELPSRMLKNCVERQFLSSFAAFSSVERFLALFVALPSAPCGVSASCRDTTTRTYYARTVATIKFRIRTRL